MSDAITPGIDDVEEVTRPRGVPMFDALGDALAGPRAAVARKRRDEILTAEHEAALEKIARRRAMAADRARHMANVRLFAEQEAAARASAAIARARQQERLDRFMPVVLSLACGLIATMILVLLTVIGAV